MLSIYMMYLLMGNPDMQEQVYPLAGTAEMHVYTYQDEIIYHNFYFDSHK